MERYEHGLMWHDYTAVSIYHIEVVYLDMSDDMTLIYQLAKT